MRKVAPEKKVVTKLDCDVETLTKCVVEVLYEEGFLASLIPVRQTESLVKEIINDSVIDEEEE